MGFTAEQLAALGSTGVLALVVVLLLRGDIVTRKAHESMLERCDEELRKMEDDRDRWQSVALNALDVTEAALGRGGR